MKRFMVKHVAKDFPELVYLVLNGNQRAQETLENQVLFRSGTPKTDFYREKARSSIDSFLKELRKAEVSLRGDWKDFNLVDLEDYIEELDEKRDELGGENPYFDNVLEAQRDEAYYYWVLKCGHYRKEEPV